MDQIYTIKNKKASNPKTLDRVCLDKKINPEIIKIDVHGAEGKVLDGSKKILKESVKVILLEMHTNEFINNFSGGMNRKKLLSF